MKKLVLAEKPSVARDIARVLRCTKKQNGFLEGNEYVVTWGLGHLVTLADAEVYSEQYKTWRLEDLPMLPQPFQLEVIRETKSQFHTVKTQLHRKDVAEIIIATDAGREGELVARWMIAKAKVKKPLKRLWISSVTDQAILNGFRTLKNGQAYDALFASAEARAEADWLVGINASRALTCKHNAQLSCGRVQTPTLAMIAGREAEIRSFKPVPFYRLLAHLDGQLKLTWQNGSAGSVRTFQKEQVEKLQSLLQGQPAIIQKIEKTKRKTYAPPLYDLTELQRDANKRYGMSPKQTSNIMQRLYEQHKLLTYPRTDSRYLSSDIVPTLAIRMKACGVGPFAKFATQILRTGIKVGAHVVDDRKVSDHHAIIPTEQPLQLQLLNADERKIYELVVKRFFAVFLPAHEFEQINLRAKIKDENFIAKGRRVLTAGWHEILGASANSDDDDHEEDDVQEQLFPDFQQGQRLSVQTLQITRGETKPPARYNEATLLSAMEQGGLGTVATRADIIEKLFGSFLIEKHGRELRITGKGLQLLD
jgi:DNA topoisomerase-3